MDELTQRSPPVPFPEQLPHVGKSNHAETVIVCVERMINAGLLQLDSENGLSVAECRIRPTAAGQLLTQKILDNVG